MHTSALEVGSTSIVSRYGIAVLAVTLAVLLTLVSHTWGYPAIYPFFFGAVLASAWLCGLLPTLVATALSASVSILFFQPFLSLSSFRPYNSGRLLAFVLYSLVTCYIVAARARLEAAHRASELHYRQLFDRNLAGVFLSTLDGRMLDCNESFARILGYDSRKEAMSHPASDFYFDKAHRDSYIEKLQKDGGAIDLEMCVKGRNDRPIWLIENLTLIEDDVGALTLIQGTIVDATERKRAEQAQLENRQEFETLVQSIHGIVWEFDAKTLTYTFISKQAEKLLGYPVKQWLNAPNFWADHLHPDDREWAVNFCADAAERKVDHQFEYRMIAVDGSIVWLRDIVTVDVADDKATFLRGMMIDISDRKRVELALDERFRFETLLTELSASFANTTVGEVDHEIGLWLKNLVEFLDIDRASFFLFDEDGKTLYRSRSHVALGIEPLSLGSLNDQLPWLSERLRQGKTIKWSRVPDDIPASAIEEKEYAVRLGTKSGLFIPALIGGSVISAIAFTSLRHFRDWPDEVVSRLRLVGETFANAVGRKRAEEALCEATRKYRDIFEHAVEGIYRTTPDGRFIAANPALASMLGYDSPNDLMQDQSDLARQIYVEPQRREEFKKLIAKHGMVRDFEFEVRRKDGSRIWISDNVRAVLSDDGEVLYYEGTSQDITEHKRIGEALRESEERYRELFENAHDAIYLHDLRGRYVSVNRAAEKLSGYSRDEIVGESFSKFIAPEYLKEIHARFTEKLTNGANTNYEVEVIAKDGLRVPVEVSSRLIYENGVPVGVQGMARDIASRKRAEEALRNLPRRLIDAQESERRRVARELHDGIGQVLTAIKINLQDIQSSTENSVIVQRLNENAAIVDNALQQVRELSLDLRPSLLDDLGLTAALRWYVERECRRMRLGLELNIADSETRLAPEVETACFRIAQEALTNIARHAHATRVQVELTLHEADLELIISDDGVGFDVPRARRRFASDASLGLQGMQERALAVGGRIEIKAVKGKGTRIHVQIPLIPNTPSLEDN